MRPVVAVAGGGCPKNAPGPDAAGAADATTWTQDVTSVRTRPLQQLLLLSAAGLLLVPLALRGAAALHPIPDLQPSYLPAIEGPRERAPFDASRVRTRCAACSPPSSSSATRWRGRGSTRRVFTRVSGQSVAPLLYAGSGPAWWYLVLKNWVIASGIRPKAVFIFFRDTNLTNVLFRIDATWSLDTAALDARGRSRTRRSRGGAAAPFYRSAVARSIGLYTARPRRGAGSSRSSTSGRRALMIPYRKPREAFMQAVNDRFGLDHLRPMDAADMQATEDREADFGAFVDKSELPLMLRDAQQAGLRLVFVRVQRRPAGGRPPYQSPALQRYVRDLRALSSRATARRSSTTRAIPPQTLDLYEDGDHLSREGRRRYTRARSPSASACSFP